MTRLLSWFTIERTTGLFMLLTCGLLILRPFASAVAGLEDAYTITLTLSALTAAQLVFGLVLIVRRIVGRLAFVILFSPMWLYALALLVTFGFSYMIGPYGFIFGVGYSGLSIYIHSLREKSVPPSET